MDKSQEQLELSPFHRLRLLPKNEGFDWQTTMRVAVHGEGKRPGNGLAPSSSAGKLQEEATAILPVPRQFKKAQFDFNHQAGQSEIPRFDKAYPAEFEAHATIPMAVLRGISNLQGESPPVMKSEITGAASNAAIVGVGAIVGYVLRYGTNLLIQRVLGAALFGLYSVSLSLVTLIASIFDLGLDNAMIRYIAAYRGKKQSNLVRGLTIFCSAVVGVTGIIGALLVLSLASSLAAIEHKASVVPLLQMMAPLVPLMCMQTIWTGGLQGFKEFKRRVFVQRFLVPVIVFVLMAVVLFFYRNIVGAALVTFLSVLISAVVNLYFLFRVISKTAESGPEEYEVRTWLGFAAPNILTTIVNTVLDSIDTLLLAWFVPALAIGQYSAAIKISGFILLPLSSLNVMFTPTIAELHAKGERQKLEAMFKVVTHWTISLSLPIFCTVTLFSVPLLTISGNSFVGAWPILMILALGSFVSVATGSVGYMLLMTGHQRYSFFNSVAAVVLNIALGLLLTPRYGAMGTAVSTALALSVVNLIRLIEVRLLLKMHPYRRNMLKPLGAGLISIGLTSVLIYLLSLTHLSIQIFHLHLSLLLLLVPVFLVSYVGLLALFGVSPEDKIVLDRVRGKFGHSKKKSKSSRSYKSH